MALIGKAPKGAESDSEEGDKPDGSAGEMAAEDFANATDAKSRYAAFKRMFKACEMEGHSEGPEAEGGDEESDY